MKAATDKQIVVLSIRHTGTFLTLELLHCLAPKKTIGVMGTDNHFLYGHLELPNQILDNLGDAKVVCPIRNPVHSFLSLIQRRYGTLDEYRVQLSPEERLQSARIHIKKYERLLSIRNAYYFPWDAIADADRLRAYKDLASYCGLRFPKRIVKQLLDVWKPTNQTSRLVVGEPYTGSEPGLAREFNLEGARQVAVFPNGPDLVFDRMKRDSNLFRVNLFLEWKTFNMAVPLRHRLYEVAGSSYGSW